jgi:hypothetical protein
MRFIPTLEFLEERLQPITLAFGNNGVNYVFQDTQVVG